jgi:hypothetical protein
MLPETKSKQKGHQKKIKRTPEPKQTEGKSRNKRQSQRKIRTKSTQ